MILLDYFRRNNVCQHDKVTPDKDVCYCPDCGELIENRWYITRCACCGIKLKAILKNGEVVPERNFCHNCGTKSHVVERVDKINFIDINYAVLVKSVIKPEVEDITQSWSENNQAITPKLIKKY